MGLGNLVNMTDGGDGAYGVLVSEETRQKISEANKGKTRSDETRQKISEARKGKIRSEETRQKMSESLKGKARSEEKRQKIRHKISESVNDKKNVKGYSFHKPSKKWRATIKTIHIGSFDTPEEAAEAYQKAGIDTIILAGNEYGSGSSRDWAAKGPYLQGVKAVIA